MIALKNIAFSLLVPGTVAGLVPYWIVSSTGRYAVEAAGPAQWLGLALAAFGLAAYLRSVVDFGSVGGTPAPIDPPRELVVRHVYRFTRNPMYVAVLSVISGQALLFRSGHLALYGALVFGAFHAFVTLYEEPVLRRHFGAAYERYCEHVPRWLGRRRGR